MSDPSSLDKTPGDPNKPAVQPPPPPPEDTRDPIADYSMSWPIAIFSFLLMLTLVWAFYQEAWGERPWIRYQEKFKEVYTEYLQKIRPEQAKAEREIRNSAEFKELEARVLNAEKAVAPEVARIDEALNKDVNPRLAKLNDVFAVARSEVAALTYKVEASGGDGREDLEELRQEKHDVELPGPDGKTHESEMTYNDLEHEFNEQKRRQGELISRHAELERGPAALRRERDEYLKSHLGGPNEQDVNGLINKVDEYKVQIRQIHVAGVELVDRCESCHAGIREPVTLTSDSMGNEKVFTSHPNRELLTIHDPERFGCSPCHNGNGTATVSAKMAHGRYKHWLWPMYDRVNVEAGCQQCHEADIVLDHATVLNSGKEIFLQRGCWGCHAREGFDPEPGKLMNVQKSIEQLRKRKEDTRLEATRVERQGDKAPDNATAQRLFARAESMRMSLARMDNQLEQMATQARDLLQDVKKIGPNLKEMRQKLRKEWVPVWLENPNAWRPGTKMPTFRLQKDEIQAISAFLWQAALTEPKLAVHPPGNAENGKELFETRGCLGCHSIGEGSSRIGGVFAANLTRVGEKANYDYLVRWIHNPRERTAPYCPVDKRDITPQDYEAKGLPFVFDRDHSVCPVCGNQLQVQQMTVMPNFRLTPAETRDIASYLMTRRKNGSYPAAGFMDDPKLKDRGRFLVRNYGCAGCHEIAGLEDAAKIGTELTKEGSKPIERLDFGLLTEKAKHEKWYDHKGFFGRKLRKPDVYDEGKIKPHLEKLKMPNFNLSEQEITALSTFLLGSVDSTLPKTYFYTPPDERKYGQDGWWVVQKYNCMGCHQLRPGQVADLKAMVPRYKDPDWKDRVPPPLVGEGARVSPDFLLAFLRNPALSLTDLHRNGVRSYLAVRMPTFDFSAGELQKLVRFFGALAYQQSPHIPAKLAPLTAEEMSLARQMFTHPAAPCLKCHTGATATAPDLAMVRERLQPGWTTRWIAEPAIIAPGTAMPSGLFRREGGRWVFASTLPASFANYKGDHLDLLVRYLYQAPVSEIGRK